MRQEMGAGSGEAIRRRHEANSCSSTITSSRGAALDGDCAGTTRASIEAQGHHVAIGCGGAVRRIDGLSVGDRAHQFVQRWVVLQPSSWRWPNDAAALDLFEFDSAVWPGVAGARPVALMGRIICTSRSWVL